MKPPGYDAHIAGLVAAFPVAAFTREQAATNRTIRVGEADRVLRFAVKAGTLKRPTPKAGVRKWLKV